MIRYLPVHVASWLLIVVFTREVYSQEKAGKCNVKMWYLDLVTEGALSRDLSDQQLILKAKIEKMVDKYKKLGRADGMVDCSILQMYEELLGEEPTGGQETQVSSDEKSNGDKTDKEAASEPDGVNGKDDESDKISEKNDNYEDEKKTYVNIKEDKQSESDDIKDDEQKKADVNDDKQDNSDGENKDEQKESDDVKEGEQKESDYKANGKDNESDNEVDDKAESNDKGNDITKDDDEGTDNREGNGDEEGGDKTGDDFVDDTDLDDTDFGDDDDEKEDDMDDDQAEAESLEESYVSKDSESSDKGSESIDKGSESTGKGSESSEKGSEASDKGSEASDKGSEASDKGSEASDKGSDSSDKGSESSDKGSESTDKGSESSDENDSESSENKGKGSSDGKDSGPSEIKDSESPVKDSSAEKKPPEDKQSSESADDKDSKSVSKESDSAGEDRKIDAEDTQVRKRKTKLVEETVFDPKRGYVKVVKEVEVDDDEEEEEEGEEEGVGEKARKDIQEKTGENEKLEKDNEKIKREEEEGVNDGNGGDNQKEKQKQKEIEEEDKRREEERERERKENVDEEKRKEKEMELAKKEEEKKEKEKAKQEEEDDGESRKKKPWEKPKNKERKPWENAKSREESYDGRCSGDACKEQNSNDSEKEDSVYKYTAQAKHHRSSEDEEPMWRKSEKPNNEAEDKKEARPVDSRDFTADLHRFEMLFQQRASEYASKIQNLEIMIIRLENQLLGERLNKQNSTSSFSKLENQILRLENELLKLNQSYADLKEENVMLKYRQRKYLELGTDKSKDQSSMGNSTKHFELINKQQNRIAELSALLMNHSALFDKLQSKSHVLEEQNQALYQIVMNQTALISNIMKKMQELSEENMKHRKETQDLKTQMEFKTNSDRLLEKLSTLVSVQIPSADISAQREEKQKSSSRVFRMHNLFPKSPDADVRPWRCNGNNSSRFCVFYSLILSPCPPFSTVYWHKCPYYYKDISQEDEIHQESSQTSKPRTNHAEGSAEESKTVDNVPSATSTNSFVNVNDGASKEASPSISSEDGKVLEEILKQERDSQSVEGKTKADTSEEKSEKVEVKSETLTSKSEELPKSNLNEKEPKGSKDSEDKAPLPTVEEVKVAPPKPIEPRHEDRKILYTTDKKLPKPRDCYEYMENGYERNGMYKIYVVGQEKHLPVYCDMNGGWTVIMKRSSGALDFYRNWNEYKKGFGGFYSEHWIGNDNLHYLTNQKHYSLKVVLEDFSFNSTFAVYDHFWIDNEDEGYRLHISGYSGTAGDGFAKHNKMKFSTKDADNDLITKELEEYDHSCAKRFTGAWWYYKCYMSNLTGHYFKNGHVPNKKFNGISWKPWKKPHISLKGAVMMIRPFNAD